MITKIFNGNILRNNIIKITKKKIEEKFILYKKKPCLAIIFINNLNSSNLYVKNKLFLCEFLKIKCVLFRSSRTIKIKTILFLIKFLNNDIKINGFFIQKPLPLNLNKSIIFKSIKIEKDVDLLNPINFKKYMFNKNNFISPSILQSILSVFNILKIEKKKMNLLIFGFSDIVGKPLYYELLFNQFNLNVINKFDTNYKNLIKCSDVIIIGIGSPFFLSKKMISYGSIIIDIGINDILEEYIVGDVNLYNLFGKASWITPVPGGIGSLTVAYLLLNIFNLYLKQILYNIKKD